MIPPPEPHSLADRISEVKARMNECHTMLDDILGGSPPGTDRRLRHLRMCLMEAILTLEDTRRTIKSKQLEELRKKLIAALAETA